MRVVHCYGQTPEMQEAIYSFYEQREREDWESASGVKERKKPEYARYEATRDWQPTVCGLTPPSLDVLRPSDFVAVVNHTDPTVDMAALDGTGFEASPYQDGEFVPDAEPCGPCKKAAPLSWPLLFYASDV